MYDREQVKKFTEQIGILPITNENWLEININLSVESTRTEYLNARKEISNKIATKMTGVYIILKEDRILYIGESQNLSKRMLKHIAKIYVRTDERSEFFKLEKNQGQLSIRYLLLESKEVPKRQDIENVLTRVLEPEYEKWYEKRYENLKAKKSMKELNDFMLFPQKSFDRFVEIDITLEENMIIINVGADDPMSLEKDVATEFANRIAIREGFSNLKENKKEVRAYGQNNLAEKSFTFTKNA